MKRVTLYTQTKCPHCKAAQQYLDSKNIKYRLIDVALPRGKKELASLGYRAVPVLKVGESIMAGFSAKQFDALYR